MKMEKKESRILFVSPEVYPYAKVGGLGDVIGSLPKDLEKLDVEVAVAMPFYEMIDPEEHGIEELVPNFDFEIGGTKGSVSVWKGKLPGSEVDVYFFRNSDVFKDEVYVADHEDPKRFVFFCLAVLAFLKPLASEHDFDVDVLHCHDWHTGILPIEVRKLAKTDDFYAKIATVFTIHNLAYLGSTGVDILEAAGLSPEEFPIIQEDLKDNDVDLMLEGVGSADMISTVSKRYAEEIQTEEFGLGLEELLKSRADRLVGIMNGIDYEVWNPETDKEVSHQFSSTDLSGKMANKKELLELYGLEGADALLIGVVNRVVEQKGIDIFVEAIEKLLGEGEDFRVIVLGTGDPKLEKMLTDLAAKYPDKVAVKIEYNGEIAKLIYAGSDAFALPSKYEPAGLGQLIAMKYGTVPIVRKTGGLADSVSEYSAGKGTGFVFDEYDTGALADAMKRAIDVYADKSAWNTLVLNDMAEDWSWTESAKEYVSMYEKVIEYKRSK